MIAQDLGNFIKRYTGVAGVGNTPPNKGECVGLVMVYIADVLKLSHIWGHAKDIYNNASESEWIKVKNSSFAYPVAGDILCWGFGVGGGYGHTAIVVSSDSKEDSVTVFEQNNPGNIPGTEPEITKYTDWKSVIGWLRPIKSLTERIKGIDVSAYQGDIDFSKVKSVVPFVIIKATEGTGFVDDKFVRNQEEARKIGMLVGYYHFARPDLNNSPEDEAKDFLETVKPMDGELLVLDFEVSYGKAVEWCKNWLDYVSKELNGYKPFIYLNQSQTTKYLWGAVIEAGYPLWLAKYDYDYTAPAPDTPWDTVLLRQYSNKECISGIAGNVDGNVFYGSVENFNDICIGAFPELSECEKKLKALDKVLDGVRTSRNSHRDENKELKGEIKALETALGKANTKVKKFETALATNKTPLSMYSWPERFKSLFGL